jgi:hypothetical protein
MVLEDAPESLYCVDRSCIRWQLVPVPNDLGEERITESLTALSNTGVKWRKVKFLDRRFFFKRTKHKNSYKVFINFYEI